MDDLIRVRKEQTTIGSSKRPSETVYIAESAQAKRIGRLLERHWLYPCDLYELEQMGFKVEIYEATTAPNATIAAGEAP